MVVKLGMIYSIHLSQTQTAKQKFVSSTNFCLTYPHQGHQHQPPQHKNYCSEGGPNPHREKMAPKNIVFAMFLGSIFSLCGLGPPSEWDCVFGFAAALIHYLTYKIQFMMNF